MHLGRGNTAGDAVVFLPKERILITGDLVVHPVPYMFGGYPGEFGRTLVKMEQIRFDTIVPGHGEVLRAEAGRNYVRRLAEFCEAVAELVSSELHRTGSGVGNLPAVREGVMKKLDVAKIEAATRGETG
jgi:glyoxylase-like metal-dependent hydrolase (beta-lactamase superfamily II)